MEIAIDGQLSSHLKRTPFIEDAISNIGVLLGTPTNELNYLFEEL